MKALRASGWAVIFTATLFLTACAMHDAQVSQTTSMSGPDTAMTQTEKMYRENAQAIYNARLYEFGQQPEEMYEDSAIVISQDWLDERERAIAERESQLEQMYEDSAIVISQDWLDERERAIDERESGLDFRADTLALREKALAIDRAWLEEREMRLAENIHDLKQQEETLALQQARMKGGTSDYIKLAGADWTPAEFEEGVADLFDAEPGAYVYAFTAGRCYASVSTPAQYKTVAVTKPIGLPKGEAFKPVLYQTVTEQVKVSDDRVSFEEILCDSNITQNTVSNIQRALQYHGFDPGPIDGVLGHQTLEAVNAFQKERQLVVANHLTIETVEALGLNY